MTNEPITDYLKRRLREVGAAKWGEVAEATGVTPSFLPKFVYGGRENPRIQTLQPLIDYFAAKERLEGVDMAAAQSAAPASRGGCHA